ncbi:NADH dehydrogenase [ubiquinone] 1 beta subcomplex subunit 5, mitochondrial [Cichlidogyrus casuarinus]|uniref:NADH dehydrogenase [ubiquinone] 1 beta subcomplex subunit 5, mitochondrial n=1 Tax=Cichlidogyrus casuarinus TaxID=1844966 RepID=A0ABD2QBS1_9PLAT
MRYGKAQLIDYDPATFQPEHYEFDEAHPLPRAFRQVLHLDYNKLDNYSNEIRKRLSSDRKKRLEARWFARSERDNKDFRGWYFIPVSPGHSNRAQGQLELDQEMGRVVRR